MSEEDFRVVCRCRLGLGKAPGMYSRSARDYRGRAELPTRWCGSGGVGRLAALDRGAADTVAVAIEVPHGPVVDSLIDRGFVVYAINPKQLDRLRDRFSVAGAKDDRRDGYVLADGVRTDRRCSVAFMLLTHGSSSCVRGRALLRNSRGNGFG